MRLRWISRKFIFHRWDVACLRAWITAFCVIFPRKNDRIIPAEPGGTLTGYILTPCATVNVVMEWRCDRRKSTTTIGRCKSTSFLCANTEFTWLFAIAFDFSPWISCHQKDLKMCVWKSTNLLHLSQALVTLTLSLLRLLFLETCGVRFSASLGDGSGRWLEAIDVHFLVKGYEALTQMWTEKSQCKTE